MKIKKVSINEIKEAPYNPRKMTQEELEKLKASIKKFGYVEPVIINKRTNFVIGGNQRLKALKELGYKEISAIILDLDEKQEKALNIALNKINGDWDIDKLKILFEELKDDEIIKYTGFNDFEISDFFEEQNIEINEKEITRETIKPKNKCPKCGFEW